MQFFVTFGVVWDDAMVARWSANPFSILWPDDALPSGADAPFRSWAMTVRPAARKIALIGTHMITPASC
jgi:hypothetical protein